MMDVFVFIYHIFLLTCQEFFVLESKFHHSCVCVETPIIQCLFNINKLSDYLNSINSDLIGLAKIGLWCSKWVKVTQYVIENVYSITF